MESIYRPTAGELDSGSLRVPDFHIIGKKII
jgi:hypothetical protein